MLTVWITMKTEDHIFALMGLIRAVQWIEGAVRENERKGNGDGRKESPLEASFAKCKQDVVHSLERDL